MIDETLQSLRKAVKEDPNDFGSRVALAKCLERTGDYREARAEAGYVLKHPSTDDQKREAVKIILPSIRYFENRRSKDQYKIGESIEDKGLYSLHQLTAQRDNITLGNLRLYYELGLADQIIPYPIANQQAIKEARKLWRICHTRFHRNVTANIARYGLTMKDVEKLSGNNDIEIEPGLTQKDTIIEFVLKPKGFTELKSGKGDIDYGDGKRHIVKIPDESGWVIWPEDRPAYTPLGLPTGKPTGNKQKAVRSMINSGLPPALAEGEVAYVHIRRPKGFKGVVTVDRSFTYPESSFTISLLFDTDERGDSLGWLRASKLKTKS